MNIEVLISTMNLDEQSKLIEEMNVSESLIINQTEKDNLKDINDGKNRLYSYKEKGLSKSRNKAIENSRGDICVIADDDLEYVNNYKKIIEDGYAKYKDADIIAFHVDNYDTEKAKKKGREGRVNFVNSMKISSVQITFKRNSIVNKNIRFNEKFGTGANWYMGEENIFLSECLRKGLKMYYIPNKIATIMNNESTWCREFNEKYFNVRGAVFYEISRFWYNVLIFQFAIRKRNKYSDKFSVIKAIKYMFDGVKKYKKECI